MSIFINCTLLYSDIYFILLKIFMILLGSRHVACIWQNPMKEERKKKKEGQRVSVCVWERERESEWERERERERERKFVEFCGEIISLRIFSLFFQQILKNIYHFVFIIFDEKSKIKMFLGSRSKKKKDFFGTCATKQ